MESQESEFVFGFTLNSSDTHNIYYFNPLLFRRKGDGYAC